MEKLNGNIRSVVRKERYKFQPNDIIRFKGEEYISKGMHNKGTRIILEGIGSKSIKDIELITYGKGLQFR